MLVRTQTTLRHPIAATAGAGAMQLSDGGFGDEIAMLARARPAATREEDRRGTSNTLETSTGELLQPASSTRSSREPGDTRDGTAVEDDELSNVNCSAVAGAAGIVCGDSSVR